MVAFTHTQRKFADAERAATAALQKPMIQGHADARRTALALASKAADVNSQETKAASRVAVARLTRAVRVAKAVHAGNSKVARCAFLFIYLLLVAFWCHLIPLLYILLCWLQ